MSQAIIETINISISYDGTSVIENFNFSCNIGEFVAIVGKSGAGKSSFLNVLAGFIPHTGEVKTTGSIGYVFQNYALFPWMTVEQNIRFGLEKLDRSEKKQRSEDILKRIDMLDYADRYPNQLSGGQIQRVALARALAPDPNVLLMDEPYGALDPLTRDKMQDWLASIWRESNKTILFVTHNIEEAIFLANRIIVIKDQKLVADIEVPFSYPRHNDLRFSEHFLDMKLAVLNYMENNSTS
jgi:ABC-type nitrate/sulfonate/bicarbonate transport system ATPase subunit